MSPVVRRFRAPLVRPLPRTEHFVVPTLSALRLPFICSFRVLSLLPECALILRSLRDPIMRFPLSPCSSCSLVVERTSILTSVPVYPALASFAALVSASSRLAPSWPAWPCMPFGKPCFLFPACSPLFLGTSFGFQDILPLTLSRRLWLCVATAGVL